MLFNETGGGIGVHLTGRVETIRLERHTLVLVQLDHNP